MITKQINLSERVKRLRAELEQSRQRIILSSEEQRAYAEIYHQVYSVNRNLPEVRRRAEFLTHFAENFPVSIGDDELIVGSQRFTHAPLSLKTREKCGNHQNHGHIIVDYQRVLQLGVKGLRQAVNNMPVGDNRTAFGQTLTAFAGFMRRHGYSELAERPPQTFCEALQLIWFMQVFLHAEGNASAVSFGRLDQYLWPFLEADIKQKRITWEDAFEWWCCFSIKCCQGDESQNLTLGGNGAENPLSLLILRAMRELKIWQPSISVRIGSTTSDEFWYEALSLCAAGIGMPSFFNEAVVTAGLEKLGIPSQRAKNWGIVGCYEAAPPGDCYPLTVGGGFTLPELLGDFLQTKSDWNSFEAFYADFKTYFSKHYRQEILPAFEQHWQDWRQNNTSPFESICVTGCMESGLAVEEGGAKFNLFGVNILGLGTLIDSLLSLKELIFEAKDLTFKQMKQQLIDNFPDRKLLWRCRNLPNKFGTDSAESNNLAQDISSFIAAEVIAHPLQNGVRPYPGFFWFGQDISRKVMASPDGRLAGERLSYGCGPGIFLTKVGPTSILNSVACLDHASCACGNPLTLSLNRKDIAETTGKQYIRQLIEGYFEKGGFHLQFNIVDANDLEEAKLNPDNYRELMVKVSGFSARFVSLDRPWQDAIIERTKLGM